MRRPGGRRGCSGAGRLCMAMPARALSMPLMNVLGAPTSLPFSYSSGYSPKSHTSPFRRLGEEGEFGLHEFTVGVVPVPNRDGLDPVDHLGQPRDGADNLAGGRPVRGDYFAGGGVLHAGFEREPLVVDHRPGREGGTVEVDRRAGAAQFLGTGRPPARWLPSPRSPSPPSATPPPARPRSRKR